MRCLGPTVLQRHRNFTGFIEHGRREAADAGDEFLIVDRITSRPDSAKFALKGGTLSDAFGRRASNFSRPIRRVRSGTGSQAVSTLPSAVQ